LFFLISSLSLIHRLRKVFASNPLSLRSSKQNPNCHFQERGGLLHRRNISPWLISVDANEISFAVQFWVYLIIIIIIIIIIIRSRHSAVGITTGDRQDTRGVGVPVPVKSRVITYLYCPYSLWSVPTNLFEGKRGLNSRDNGSLVLKLTNQFQPFFFNKTWICISTPQ
jgi:hypothetical protein